MRSPGCILYTPGFLIAPVMYTFISAGVGVAGRLDGEGVGFKVGVSLSVGAGRGVGVEVGFSIFLVRNIPVAVVAISRKMKMDRTVFVLFIGWLSEVGQGRNPAPVVG